MSLRNRRAYEVREQTVMQDSNCHEKFIH